MSTGEEFEWDETKNSINQVKHGLSFEVAQLTFDDPYRVLADDLDHSEEEDRKFCFGYIEGIGVVSVRFTFRAHKIRIIGAGVWRGGRERYYAERNRIH